MSANWMIKQKVDLSKGYDRYVVWEKALLVPTDNKAHTWSVEVVKAGENVSLEGYSVSAYLVRSDGNAVLLTGSISGNVASVDFAQSCYAYEGQLRGVMQLIKTGEVITIAETFFTVRESIPDTIVDPGQVIPSLEELLAQIEACREATEDANEAAVSANSAASSANTAASNANTKADLANTAASNADEKATLANTAATNADAKATLANNAATAANSAASDANTAATNANEKAELAEEKAEEANSAAERAEAAAESIENKADIDGYYETLGAGTADQLTSPDGIEDTPYNDEEYNPFLIRTTAGTASVSDGNAEIRKIIGSTIVWNQLNRNNKSTSTAYGVTFTKNSDGTWTLTGNGTGTERKLISDISMTVGHVYAVLNGGIDTTGTGTYLCLTNSGSNLTAFYNDSLFTADKRFNQFSIRTTSNFVAPDGGLTYTPLLIDLTDIYGADNVPTSTNDRKFKIIAYIAYMHNEYTNNVLVSVNPSALKTVGFNQMNTSGKAKVIEGNQYEVVGTYTSVAYSDGTAITLTNGKFTPTKTDEITVTGFDDDTCVHLTWSGYRNGEYEEYWSSNRQIDITSVRGTPVGGGTETAIFPNGLLSAGNVHDELTATKAIKRVGTVDLGTISYSEYGSTDDVTQYFSPSLDNDAADMSPTLSTIFINSTSMVAWSAKFTYSNGKFYIRTPKDYYESAIAFKTAMDGVMLQYELATPIEYDLTTPLNLTFRESDFGTEEFVYDSDDVPVPVPCEIFYMDNLRDKLRLLNELTEDELNEILGIL